MRQIKRRKIHKLKNYYIKKIRSPSRQLNRLPQIDSLLQIIGICKSILSR